MNLVPIANVVAAIIFLAKFSGRCKGEVFIVSNDDDPRNNFIDVERFLTRHLGAKDCYLPRLPVPLIVLKSLLMLLGRNNVNPCCNFDPGKLRKLGFRNPVSLSDGLAEYAAWFRTLHADERGSKAA
jgi:nucleoside-diphosphate-sugar epimerase